MIQQLRLLVLGIVGFLGVFFAHGSWLNRLLAFALCGVLGADSGLCMAQVAKFSGQAMATTPTLLSQRSRDFDNPPNSSPANNPQAPPFPQDAGPNFIRPDFAGNNPNQPLQDIYRASFAVVEPNRIYRINGFNENRLKQYTTDILIENGISNVQSITADLKTGNPDVDGVYHTQFNQGENFSFKITKNVSESLMFESISLTRWRIIFTKDNNEVFNLELEKNNQVKQKSNNTSYIFHSRESIIDDNIIMIADNSCNEIDKVLGTILNKIDKFAEEIVKTFNYFGIDIVRRLPPGRGGIPSEMGKRLKEGAKSIQIMIEGLTEEVRRKINELKACDSRQTNPTPITSPTQATPAQPSVSCGCFFGRCGSDVGLVGLGSNGNSSNNSNSSCPPTPTQPPQTPIPSNTLIPCQITPNNIFRADPRTPYNCQDGSTFWLGDCDNFPPGYGYGYWNKPGENLYVAPPNPRRLRLGCSN